MIGDGKFHAPSDYVNCELYLTCVVSRMTEAKDFEGPDGPEEKIKAATVRRPGDDDVLVPQDLKHKGIK